MDAAGIRTRVLLMNWIGQVLGGVARQSHRRGQPLLSCLCVHADGTVGDGYGQAVLDNYGAPLPGDLDMHAAVERLRCYQHFGARALLLAFAVAGGDCGRRAAAGRQ